MALNCPTCRIGGSKSHTMNDCLALATQLADALAIKSREEDGVRGGIRTHGPRIHTTSAFAAALRRSWSGLSLHHRTKGPLGVAHPVSTPSSFEAWLGIGMTLGAEAFPDFERIRRAVSERDAQFKRNPVLYPAELRRHLLIKLTTEIGGICTLAHSLLTLGTVGNRRAPRSGSVTLPSRKTKGMRRGSTHMVEW
jgi:hypothetical protein